MLNSLTTSRRKDLRYLSPSHTRGERRDCDNVAWGGKETLLSGVDSSDSRPTPAQSFQHQQFVHTLPVSS